MNIDGTNISDLLKINTLNKQNASAQAGSVEFVNCAGAFFDDENKITSAENTRDAYDRIGDEKDRIAVGDKTGEMAITKETIDKIASVVVPEDFSKYEEWGLMPDKDDPTHILTVSERIEIELAAYCDGYKATGSIDSADVKEMFGNTAMAYQIEEAVNKAVNIEKIGRNQSEYLLTNNMELTIDNVYKAQHSVNSSNNSGYQILNDRQWESLEPQVEKILVDNGIEVNETNLLNGKWLIEEKIPVTAENLYKLNQIDVINNNIERGISVEQWTDNIISNMRFGMSAGDTSADYYHTIAGDSFIANEIIVNGTEEQIETLVMDGKEVTLLNMKKTEEIHTSEAMKVRRETATKEQRQKIEENRRCLEELRLKMTIEASAVMIKNGINIDITPLTKLVDELKNMETEFVMDIFSAGEEKNSVVVTAEQTDMFLEFGKIREGLYSTPAYVLGSVIKTEIEFTSEGIFYTGQELADKLKNAGEAYETLGTKPDKELGDSLNKAFAGIRDLLKENGMDYSEENARAVRILAYNQMEISKENIFSIKEMDVEVSRLIDNMTPKTTAYLIANGINPLKTDIRELNEILDDINEKIGIDGIEKYSEYLWKLEKNKEISEEDREAYIGIYRLINMVEKGDRRAVGAVVKQGLDMNMKNLLAAARSLKHTGKEVVVDENYGIAEEIKLSDTNIDKQIGLFETSAFIKRAWDNISPENVRKSLENTEEDMSMDKSLENMTLDKMLENMAENSKDYNEELLYNRLRCNEIGDAARLSEEALINIMEDGNSRTMENIIGISYYVMNGRKTFSGIKTLCDDEKVEEDIDSLKEMLEGDGSASDVAEKIMETSFDIKDALINKKKIDVKELRNVCRVSSYMTRAAGNNSFYVPVNLYGEETTIKITLRTSEENKGTVNIKMNTGKGQIVSDISVKNGRVNAFIAYANEEDEGIRDIEKAFSEELDNKGFILNSFVAAKEKYEGMNITEIDKDSETTNNLFVIAKAFIKSIKNSD